MALSKLGVECKLVKDTDYVVGFPSKKIKKWIGSNKKFKKIIKIMNNGKFSIDKSYFNYPYKLEGWVSDKFLKIFYLYQFLLL